jgi:hypothetical protein
MQLLQPVLPYFDTSFDTSDVQIATLAKLKPYFSFLQPMRIVFPVEDSPSGLPL